MRLVAKVNLSDSMYVKTRELCKIMSQYRKSGTICYELKRMNDPSYHLGEYFSLNLSGSVVNLLAGKAAPSSIISTADI